MDKLYWLLMAVVCIVVMFMIVAVPILAFHALLIIMGGSI